MAGRWGGQNHEQVKYVCMYVCSMCRTGGGVALSAHAGAGRALIVGMYIVLYSLPYAGARTYLCTHAVTAVLACLKYQLVEPTAHGRWGPLRGINNHLPCAIQSTRRGAWAGNSMILARRCQNSHIVSLTIIRRPRVGQKTARLMRCCPVSHPPRQMRDAQAYVHHPPIPTCLLGVLHTHQAGGRARRVRGPPRWDEIAERATANHRFTTASYGR